MPVVEGGAKRSNFVKSIANSDLIDEQRSDAHAMTREYCCRCSAAAASPCC